MPRRGLARRRYAGGQQAGSHHGGGDRGGRHGWCERAAAGVHAGFSLPLTVGPGGTGTLDLCRDRPGMLSDDHPADALVAAELLATAGTDRIVIHQAIGMITARLDATIVNALTRLRAATFASDRPIYDVAQDVVERRVRFDE